MWKKKTLALLTAVAMAGSAIQPVMAQGNYDRGYDNGYNNGYGDRGYDNGPPPPPSDYDRYERDRDQYERDRDRYEADRAASARWDRTAYYQECERQRQGNTAGGAIVGALA